MDDTANLGRLNQIRSLPELVIETVETSAQFIGHPGNIAGFMLLFGAGLAAVLLLHKPKRSPSDVRPVSLGALPLLVGIIAQLCFVPILWRRWH